MTFYIDVSQQQKANVFWCNWCLRVFFSLLGSHKAALKITLFANHTAEGLKTHIII